MQVCINNQPVSVSPEDGRTVGDLIDSLRRREAIPQAEAVVGLAVDGRPWGREELERADEATLSDLDRIEISTGGLQDYARRALRDAESMVRVMTEAAGAVAQRFREGALEEANGHLYQLLEALHRFLAFVNRMQNACSPGRRVLTEGGELIGRLADALDAIQGKQEDEDWAGLATEIEGGLVAVFRDLTPALRAMAAEV